MRKRGYGHSSGSADGGSSVSKTLLILGGVGGIALIAIIGLVVFFVSGGSEDAEKEVVAQAASDSVGKIVGSDNLVTWNVPMCSKYDGVDDGVPLDGETFGDLDGGAMGMDIEPVSYAAKDVTFTNDDRTAAKVGTGSDVVQMAKENEEWKICDPAVSLTIFDGASGITDMFEGFGS